MIQNSSRPVRLIAAVLACLTLLLPGACQRSPSYPQLSARIDHGFQKSVLAELEAEIPGISSEEIEPRNASLVVVDITDLDEPRVASFNGDKMLYAASLPKIAILLGAFVQIDRGELEFDDALRNELTQMIRKSSNEAASAVLGQVGFETLAEILQSEQFNLYNPDDGGGLWVGRDYGGGRSWKRDPVNNLSHGASAMKVARLYYLLLTDRLVAPDLKAEFMEILSDPGIDHKFVAGLAEDNPDAEVYRKSGTWKTFHADSGIVVDPDYSYIIVAITDDPEGAQRLPRIAQAADAAVRKKHVR